MESSTISKVKFAEFIATIQEIPKPYRHSVTNGRSAIGPDSPIPEGHRNATLASRAGVMRNRGFSQDAIEAALLRENTVRCTPPLDEDEVVRIAKSVSRYEPGSTRGNSSIVHQQLDFDEPLFSIDACRAANYLAAEPPPIKWLLVNTLPAGVVGILVAPGGTGKSWYLIQMGVSIATGIPLAGVWDVGETGSVLMFLAEDDAIQIQRRLHNLIGALPADQLLSIRDALFKNLIIVPRVAENNLLTAGTPYSREVELTEIVDRVIADALQLPDLKLIVIDPVSRFRGGDENSAQDTTRFVEALEKIAKATGAAVIAAHHSNKSAMNSSEPSQSASRGSSALTDGVRWQMNLTTFSEKDAKNFGIPVEEKGFHLTATITKNNYAPPQPSAYLKRREGGYLDKSDLMPLAQAKAETLQASIIELVSAERKANRKYSKTAFTNQFAGEDGPLKTGNNKVRDVVQELLDCRRLTLDSAKKLALPVRAKIKKS